MQKIKEVIIMHENVGVQMGDGKKVFMHLGDAEMLIKNWLSSHGFNIVEVPEKGEWIEL